MKHSFAHPPLQSSTTFLRDRRKPVHGGSLTAVQAVRVPEQSAEALALCASFNEPLMCIELMKSHPRTQQAEM